MNRGRPRDSPFLPISKILELVRYISLSLIFEPDPSVTTFLHEQRSSGTSRAFNGSDQACDRKLNIGGCATFGLNVGKPWVYAKLHGQMHSFAAIE